MTNIIDVAFANVQRYKACFARFKACFGVSLKPFWVDNLVGFHLTKFDEEIIQSGDEAMNVVVLRKYGEAGVRLIEELL